MRILITGSNGFIGTHLSNFLIEYYHILGIGLKDKSYNRITNYYQVDISNEHSINYAIKKIKECDIIIHTAACIDMNNDNNDLFDINCKGTNNILIMARELKCRQIIHISSIPIIGKPVQLPITEEHTINPITVYHITKYASELILNQGHKYGINTVNLRIPSPIGIGMNEKTLLSILINKCINNNPITLYGNGGRQQNYIDVYDICRAIYLCIKNDVEGTYNIASKNLVSNLELAKLCIEVTNSNSTIQFVDKIDPEEALCWDISFEKAKNVFGYNHGIDIKESIKSIYEHWK